MANTPAERYALAREHRQHRASAAGLYEDSLPFALDDFQREANQALETGHNVIVAAPTGAGKTVIADFAVFLARRQHVKAFYTTPIKALSNQKYHDLVELYGPDEVGLLTGDTSVNSEANIVVMTTEVLRNMLYEHSDTLASLKYVILDEVHYLADKFRGPVWEEVILQLPGSVRIIGLSATVSNVEDFSDWIASVRGDTKLVVSERRPVPLEQHVLVQADEHTEPQVFDLYRHDSHGEQTPKLNPDLIRKLDELDHRAAKGRPHRKVIKRSSHDEPIITERHTPRRWAVVDELNYLDMLPGIYFIFSRNGCDQAVQQCLSAGLELTTQDEALRIRRIVDDMVTGQLSREDLQALRFEQFRFALEEGFAPHHAGMITLFRQIVERLFEEGLVRMVFATETLALGINMPARSVVVEKLDKFDGTGRVALTPGEFTQLTGRAGRRGIDTVGHAVVIDHRGFVPQTVASLSSKRVYPLHSNFRPTFNMAVNLLHSSEYATCRHLLDHSFAQWETNSSAWELESQMHELEHALEGYEQAFSCEYGDVKELLLMRMELADLQKDGRKRLKHQHFRTDAERTKAWRSLDDRIAALKRLDRDHPCQRCPSLADHLKWGHRWTREYRQLQRVRQRYESRTGSVARQFDTICTILTSLNYLERMESKTGIDYQLSERGELLRHVFSEHDLVLAEALCEGALSNLDARSLAATLSSMVYQARHHDIPERRMPGGPQSKVAQAAGALTAQATRLNVICDDAGLPTSDDLDFGMANAVYAWAKGDALSAVLETNGLDGGDFVRNAQRLVDLLQQVSTATVQLTDGGVGLAALSDTAREAQSLIDRGVVAYSGVE